jgi:hypothetical protein
MPFPPIGSLWHAIPNSQEIFAYPIGPSSNITTIRNHHTILVLKHPDRRHTTNSSPNNPKGLINVIVFPETLHATIFSSNFHNTLSPIAGENKSTPTLPQDNQPKTETTFPPGRD